MSAELVPLASLSEAEVTALVAAVAGADAAARWGATVHAPQRRASLLRARAVPGAGRRRGPATASRRPSATSSGAAWRRCRADCTGRCSTWRPSPARPLPPTCWPRSPDRPPAEVDELARRGGGCRASLVRDDAGRAVRPRPLPRGRAGRGARRRPRRAAPPAGRGARRRAAPRGRPVLAGDLARHAVAGAARRRRSADALAWAREAAAVEEARYAFAEAARHLGRVRRGRRGRARRRTGTLVGLAVAEADLLLKAGEARRRTSCSRPRGPRPCGSTTAS